MSSEVVLVAIPTYNERDNLPVLLDRFKGVPGNFHFLIVDDNSPDGTAEVVESLKSEIENLFLLRRPSKLGIGSAHRAAIHYAYDHGYKFLATMDADLTHSPESLGQMLEFADKADIVLGSRYVFSRSLPGWNLFRRFLTHAGHFVTSFFLKIPYDATGGLRVYNLKTIPRPFFDLTRANGYSFLYESLFILWTNGCQVVEIPISLPARTYGSSKMSLEQIAISVLRLVLLYTNLRVAPDLYRLKRSNLLPNEESQAAESSWDRYWGGAKRERASDILFEICATLFRTVFNKPFLERILRRFLQPGDQVLHAGCGSGQVDQKVRYLFKLTACDISAGAVRMYNQVNWPHSECAVADILDLPYEDNRFDGLYNMGVMEHFSEEQIRLAFSEFYRVLRPGGRIVIFWPPLKSPIRHVLSAFHWLARLFDTKTKDLLYPPEISRVASQSQGEAWLREAGFRPVYCEFSALDLYTQYAFVAEKPHA